MRRQIWRPQNLDAFPVSFTLLASAEEICGGQQFCGPRIGSLRKNGFGIRRRIRGVYQVLKSWRVGVRFLAAYVLFGAVAFGAWITLVFRWAAVTSWSYPLGEFRLVFLRRLSLWPCFCG